MDEKETVLFENGYGLVSNRRIVLKRKVGYESIPIDKVGSVSFGHRRNYLALSIYFGLVIAIVALVAYLVLKSQRPFTGFGGTELLILSAPLIILFTLGLIKLIGYYYVQVNMDGEGRKIVKVSVLKGNAGRALMEAINREVFSR